VLAPDTLSLVDEEAVWPLRSLAEGGQPLTLHDLPARIPNAQLGPWADPLTSAMLWPLWRGAGGPAVGVAVLGLSSRVKLDAAYEDFLRVIAQHISTGAGRGRCSPARARPRRAPGRGG